MKNKTKPDTSSLLRVPKAKNKLGLKIHEIAMPHDDLIRAEATPDSKTVEITSLPSLPSLTRQTTKIAPVRDFQKTPNSLTRRAIPDGLFKGKSKQLYDALYSLTRGAILPARHTRIRKSKLMKLANIGSRATFDSNIRHLQLVGLINESVLAGEHEGNKFEVFLPEEITTLPSLTSLTSQTNSDYSAQKQVRLVCLETSQTRQSLKPVNTGVSEDLKTSFKDNTENDDDSARVNGAFSTMVERLDAAAKKLTGKNSTAADAEKWGILADLLILELEAAAKRTDSISSVPSFLTEVLRRKLLTGNISKSAERRNNEPDVVGKPNESGEYEKQPLDQKGRREALAQLTEFAGDEFLQDFRKWYTEEDWLWLVEQLKNK